MNRPNFPPLIIVVLVAMVVVAFSLYPAGPGVLQGAEHLIHPGEAPQPIMDRAAAGDRLVFLPGLHQHKLSRHRSLLYVDKSIEIELQEGAILKLADHQSQLEKIPEITTDQDAGKKLDDLSIGGTYSSSKPLIYTIIIDSEGKDGQSDTFAWGDGKLFDTPTKNVPITGDWQELSHGVKVRFESKTGHSHRSLWFVSYDGPEAYGIRIGHGTQAEPIENVRITGKGTIDLNALNNVLPSGLVKDINACVLIHGRVRNVFIDGITMTNTMRSVMMYGEHTGEFLPGGRTTPGESFDAENITVQFTRTLNPSGSGYLLGHPSHRGRLRNVRCNHNYMETATTSIEPNFNLEGYEVIDNIIQSDGEAIHCWRHSSGGVIESNVRIRDNTGKVVVKVNSPKGWEAPEPPQQHNNRNHLSDR